MKKQSFKTGIAYATCTLLFGALAMFSFVVKPDNTKPTTKTPSESAKQISTATSTTTAQESSPVTTPATVQTTNDGEIFRIGNLSIGLPVAQAQTGERTYRDPYTGHRYVYVPGRWTQSEAWSVARSRGGYPVVFSDMGEHQRVVHALRYWEIAPAHTGHRQRPDGLEPHGGWETFTGQISAHLHDLFNSNGPDDGIRNKWGWCFCNGITVYYGPSNGLNEDAGVIWHDNYGRLEAVSVNHRGGVVIEFNR